MPRSPCTQPAIRGSSPFLLWAGQNGADQSWRKLFHLHFHPALSQRGPPGAPQKPAPVCLWDWPVCSWPPQLCLTQLAVQDLLLACVLDHWWGGVCVWERERELETWRLRFSNPVFFHLLGQAMEIGSAALNILVECWDGHLTPPEVASLADRASRARDPNMVRAAAELALSCLPHAHALNPNEIQRALVQCKEQVL